MQVTETGAKRFAISSEPNFAVVETQLRPVDLSTVNVEILSDSLVISNITNEQGDDVYSYTLTFNPLSLVQTANGIQTLKVFDQNSLYVEKTTGVNESVCGPVQGVEEHLKAGANDYTSYAMDIDYKVAIGAGVKFNAQFLSGIPEHETNSDEADTTSTMPYRMFDIDFYGHTSGDPQAGYGSIPYITGHHSGDTTTS